MLHIGKKIRKIRKQQNRTLEEIATYCGVTKSMLSKIENGVTTPTIARLMKIAEALGVQVSDLLQDKPEVGTVFTSAETYTNPEHLTKTEKGYSFYAFAAGRADKSMQPYYFVLKKGEIKQHTLSHEGDEFLFILEGELKYRVGHVEYTLQAGDTIYFSSWEEHEFTPLSDVVKYLAIISNR